MNKNPTYATVCRYLFTAKLLYMFRVSQHPSTGVLKTVSAASGTGHTTCTATHLQRGLIGTGLCDSQSAQHVSGDNLPILRSTRLCLQLMVQCTDDADTNINFIIIIIIIIIIIYNYMQGIYDYIPLTIHVSRVYSFAAILYLQFILRVRLCPMLNVYFISALSAVCVQCSYLI